MIESVTTLTTLNKTKKSTSKSVRLITISKTLVPIQVTLERLKVAAPITMKLQNKTSSNQVLLMTSRTKRKDTKSIKLRQTTRLIKMI